MATSGHDLEAAEILATTVARLHGQRNSPCPTELTPLESQFSALYARAASMPLLGRCAAVSRDLLASARDAVPLHGDLHHDNVLDGGPRGWLTIDPKALLGERAYEIANLLGNPFPHGEIVHRLGRMKRLAEFYAGRLHLDLRRVLGFALAHAGLAASWDLDDGCDPTYRLRCAELLDPMVD
jgi:streptomycin 6-kinase